MKDRQFYFNKAESRIVSFSISQFSLHNFKTDEWVVTLSVDNQFSSWGQSYLLEKNENIGDPRSSDFMSKLLNLIAKIKGDLAGNEYRRIYPVVCDLHTPNFKGVKTFLIIVWANHQMILEINN